MPPPVTEAVSPSVSERVSLATADYVRDERAKVHPRSPRGWSVSLRDGARVAWSIVTLSLFVICGFFAVWSDNQWLMIAAGLVSAVVFAFLISGADPDGSWFRGMEWLVPRMATAMMVVCLLLVGTLVAFSGYTLFGTEASPLVSVVITGTATVLLGMSLSFTRSPVSVDDAPSRLWHSSVPDAAARALMLLVPFAALAYLWQEDAIEAGAAISAGIAVLGLGGLGFLRALVRRRRVLTAVVASADSLLDALVSSDGDVRTALQRGLHLERTLRTAVDSGLSPLRVPCASARTTATLMAYLAVLSNTPAMAESSDRVAELVHRQLLSAHRRVVNQELLDLCLIVRRQASRYVDVVI